VQVHLIHHAEALPPQVDFERPLSSHGLRQADWLAGQAAAAGCRPDVIWHSGKRRARQTAEAFLRLCRPSAEFRMVRGLRPDDLVDWMRHELATESRDVLLVGHMPHIARLLDALAPGIDHMPLHGGVALLRHRDGTWTESWRAEPPAELRDQDQ
jgi:phosphohistidine phosphatase